MMAQSKCSNQRPDTLMQDRRRQFDEIFLQRTAGPYMGSKAPIPITSGLPPTPDILGARRHVSKVPFSD
jgi:hypothetical protein